MNSFGVVVILCFGAIVAYGMPDGGQTGQILTNVGNRCLEVPNRWTNHTVHVAECHGGRTQEWTRMHNGTIQLGGKCLTVRGGLLERGTAVQLRNCRAGIRAQQFRFSSTGAIVYDPRENNKNIRCLDVQGQSNHLIQIWTCGRKNRRQMWTFKQ